MLQCSSQMVFVQYNISMAARFSGAVTIDRVQTLFTLLQGYGCHDTGSPRRPRGRLQRFDSTDEA